MISVQRMQAKVLNTCDVLIFLVSSATTVNNTELFSGWQKDAVKLLLT
jgi:hypothetical protein